MSHMDIFRIGPAAKLKSGGPNMMVVGNAFKVLKITTAIFTATVLVACGGLAKGKAASETAIAHFHELYNQGKTEQIWKEASPKFQVACPREKFDPFMGALQRKLGKVVSTSNDGFNVKSINFTTTVNVTQNTIFEQGQGSESFSFVMDGTNAVLLGYNIQSMDLIIK